jgi:L-cysteine/cystine lyase
MLFVGPALRERLAVPRRGYPNLADPNAGLDSPLHEDARRFDAMSLSGEALACALSAIELLESVGWSVVHERARSLAAQLAERLTDSGRELAPRDHTTLVSFSSVEPEDERALLAEHGCIVRDIPGRPWLRASVGAWNDESDLERLLASLST